jgi:hypothetical protein
MKRTKKFPVTVSFVYPDGRRIEARIPLSTAYLILAEVERDNELRAKTT